MSQYYSQRIIQKRGQEIVGGELEQALVMAIKSYSQRCNNTNPEHFIIYRDGVGDAMRAQVLQTEITQFKQAVSRIYNKAQRKPLFTVIIVNKRITQRFFVEQNEYTYNPPSGCIINRQLVENQQPSSSEFDFFLVPQNTTQGCVLPTHFYVCYNDSLIRRDSFEKLTFALCHYYFNWAGPIKVPAPCMYAHKIAELFMNLGDNYNKKPEDKIVLGEAISESLHFL